MTTVATLDSSPVEVVPGQEAVCHLTIRNTATIVEAYEVQVLGEPERWAVAEPSTISVYPGAEATVAIRFRPPVAGAPDAGDVVYAVRVTPSQAPDEEVVPEGVVRVLPYSDTGAEISPQNSRSRWRGRHRVAVDNRGNQPISVTLTGGDPDNRLIVSIRPTNLHIGAGAAAFAKVRARPRKLRWRGQPVTQPFHVLVTEDDATPIRLDATATQPPIVPAGAGRLLAVALVLLLLGTGLWFAVLRPAVRSAAKEAVAQPMVSLQQGQKRLEDIVLPQQAGNPGGGAQPSPTPTAEAPTSPAPPPGGLPPGSTAFSQPARTFANGNGGTATVPYTTPAGKTLVLTDLYLQNPQGDVGKLELLIDGTPFFTWSLANFRADDYHAVSPIEVAAGKPITARLTCLTPGPPLAGFTGSQCRVWILYSGYQKPATP